MRRLILAGLATTAILALAGCSASSKLTSVWTDPSFQTNSLRNILVIAAANKPGVRRVFEDQFVAKLHAQGVNAVASYTLVGDGSVDSTIVANALREKGLDGVFVTRLVDRQTVETYYPPTSSVVSAPSPYYGGWYGYYSVGYAYTTSPGYTVANEVVNLETNLYRASDAKLVWSALSESWLSETGDPGPEIAPFIDQLVYGLASSKVIVKGK